MHLDPGFHSIGESFDAVLLSLPDVQGAPHGPTYPDTATRVTKRCNGRVPKKYQRTSAVLLLPRT